MKQQGHSHDRPAWGLLWATISFLVIYSIIHIVLNLTSNGAYQFQWPSDTLIAIYEVSGPLTIGISTTVLMLSFGMFLKNSLENVSLAYPDAFITSFLVFVWTFIIIQIAGHAEIYTNECGAIALDSSISAAREAYQAQIGRSACHVWFPIKLFSQLTYIALPISIYIMDTYQKNIYEKMKDQIPEEYHKEVPNLAFNRILVWISIFIVVPKLSIFIIGYPEEHIWVKYTASVLSLIGEFILLLFIYGKYFGKDLRDAIGRCSLLRSARTRNQSDARNVD